MIGNCKECRNSEQRKKCSGNSWYSPDDIRYCQHQVTWMLKYICVIRDNYWPTPNNIADDEDEFTRNGIKYKISGYTAEWGSRIRTLKCPFETVSCVVAELDYRLARIDEAPFTHSADGLMLEAFYRGVDHWELATQYKINETKVVKRINRALAYVVGCRVGCKGHWRTRKYVEFVLHRRVRVYEDKNS